MAEVGLMTRRVRGVVSPGPAVKRVLEEERDVRAVSRQSLVAVRELRPGHVLEARDVTVKRPGTGVPPFALEEAVGRRVVRPVATDTVIAWTDLEDGEDEGGAGAGEGEEGGDAAQ
jgi:sialic acid synthase SpsE